MTDISPKGEGAAGQLQTLQIRRQTFLSRMGPLVHQMQAASPRITTAQTTRTPGGKTQLQPLAVCSASTPVHITWWPGIHFQCVGARLGPHPQVLGSRGRSAASPSQCLISRMEGFWSRMARMILSMYCRSRKLISSCSLRASMSSSREAVSISEAKDCALVWVAKRFFAS